MLQKEDYLSVLVPTMPFKQLKIAKYTHQAKVIKLFKGESIAMQCDCPDDLYYFYVDKGQLTCEFTKVDGQPAIMLYRNQGNAFSCSYGSIASLGGYRMRHVATRDTVVCGFTLRQLHEITSKDSEILYEFVVVCHMAFGQMGHRLAYSGIASKMKRLAFWLHKLALTQGADDDGVYRIPAHITNQQMADLLSIHPTTCSRLMGQLKQEGIIVHERNMIIVNDLQRLMLYED